MRITSAGQDLPNSGPNVKLTSGPPSPSVEDHFGPIFIVHVPHMKYPEYT